jgi:heat shock protein HslJ
MNNRKCLLVFFLFLVSACAVKQSSTPADHSSNSPAGYTWQLMELRGTALSLSGKDRAVPHITFEKDSGKVNGNGGCNSFFGSYTITEGYRIRITGLGSTMMACADVPFEQDFFDALQTADNFTLSGDTLSLNKARMAPLARLVRRNKP